MKEFEYQVTEILSKEIMTKDEQNLETLYCITNCQGDTGSIQDTGSIDSKNGT